MELVVGNFSIILPSMPRYTKFSSLQVFRLIYVSLLLKSTTRAACKIRGLAAVRRGYAEGGGDCYGKL
jgi:hypothetical protein